MTWTFHIVSVNFAAIDSVLFLIQDYLLSVILLFSSAILDHGIFPVAYLIVNQNRYSENYCWIVILFLQEYLFHEEIEIKKYYKFLKSSYREV